MPHRPLPSLAMVLTVRDEERFLLANLTYHRALGVSRAYVFLDRCTDASRQIAASLPWVRTIDDDLRSDDRSLMAYQGRCAGAALELARAEGFEWLLRLDADEFAYGDGRPGTLGGAHGHRFQGRDNRPRATGSLPRMLAGVAPSTEAVILLPKEVVPTPLRDGEPFWKLHYFRTRPTVERRILDLSRRGRAAWELPYLRARLAVERRVLDPLLRFWPFSTLRHFGVSGMSQSRMLDPNTGQMTLLSGWLGHTLGKSIVRTSADIEPGGNHRWARGGTGGDWMAARIPTEYRGSLYHFFVVSGTHWREKFAKLAAFPELRRVNAAVKQQKSAWTRASLVMSEAEADAYYDRWIVVHPRQLLWPRLRGDVVRDTMVETVLASGPSSPGTDLVPRHRPPISPLEISR